MDWLTILYGIEIPKQDPKDLEEAIRILDQVKVGYPMPTPWPQEAGDSWTADPPYAWDPNDDGYEYTGGYPGTP